ncbi:MAG TPA: LuxR C-terminal-related transcriptional regulator [Solirubrobacteraceae bacterium]|jgi:DNA-binding CsgD family transcriptional regulator
MSTIRQPPPDRDEHGHDGGGRTTAESLRPHGGDAGAAILLAVSHALTAWEGFDRSTERLLGELAGALGLAAGVLWLPAGEALVVTSAWGETEGDRAHLERTLRPLRVAPGECLCGAAWERREPIHRALASAQRPSGSLRGQTSELCAHVAVPVSAGEEVLAVVELYAAAHAELSAHLIEVLGAAGHLLGTVFTRRRGELRLSPLTARELEVITLAADGLTGRMIAELLEISPATVKTHFEHIFRKLGVGDRTSAVAYALRGGLIA